MHTYRADWWSCMQNTRSLVPLRSHSVCVCRQPEPHLYISIGCCMWYIISMNINWCTQCSLSQGHAAAATAATADKIMEKFLWLLSVPYTIGVRYDCGYYMLNGAAAALAPVFYIWLSTASTLIRALHGGARRMWKWYANMTRAAWLCGVDQCSI